MTDRTCPACKGPPVPRGYLLCRECWHAVPKPLQRDVHATWRIVNRTPNADRVAKLGAVTAYRNAANAATLAARKVRFPEAVPDAAP